MLTAKADLISGALRVMAISVVPARMIMQAYLSFTREHNDLDPNS
jgi:hypothetical protein